MKKNVFLLILILPLYFILSACTASEKSSPIVVPPGSEINYTNSEFVQVAKEFYSVELKIWDKATKKFITVENLTPKENPDQNQSVKYIVPKNMDSSGFYIVEVQMSRLGLNYQAIVVPGSVTTPDMATTLAFELLSKYPNKEITENSQETVNYIEQFMRSSIAETESRVKFPDDISLQAKYKFFKNSFSNNLALLKWLDKNSIKFSFNSSGIVQTEPFPFGRRNILPSLDSSNSTPLTREVRGSEKSEIKIKGFALDPENDFILYQWYKDDVYYGFNPKEFIWTPDFDGSKPDPYVIKLTISDGGTPQEFKWNLIVDNLNRKPFVTKNCPTTVTEWQPYTCKISAQDFDGEAMSFTVSDQGLSARVKMNGQTTDDATRKKTISGLSEATIEFTPNNEDALRRSAYIEVSISDTSGGTEVVPLNIFIDDINSPPDIVGSYTQLSTGGGQHEWDYCTNQDPDGKAPFFFKIEVRDPDNQPAAFPRSQHPDKVQVNIAGTLADRVSRIDDPSDTLNYAPGACPATTQEVMYFCYVWKPTQTEKSGTLTFTLKDNHGGISPLKIVTIVADDRNQKPCLGNISLSNVLNELIPFANYKASATDADSDLPNMTMTNVNPMVMPFLVDCSNSSSPVILKENFYDNFFSGKIYRIQSGAGGTASHCVKANFTSPYSGAVTFSRPSPFSADVAIPAGYPLETAYPGSGYRLKYQVSVPVTMGPTDKSVTVPVSATDRTANAGEIVKIVSNVPGGFIPPADLTVTNPTSLSNRGNVIFTRTNTTAVLNFPTGVNVKSDESASPTQSSFYFKTTKRYKMDVGVASLTVPVVGKSIQVPIGALTVLKGAALPDSGISISNSSLIAATTNYSLYQENQMGTTKDVDNFCWNLWAEDGYKAPVGSINHFVQSPLSPDLSVSNPASFNLVGSVRISRTNVSGALTIPLGTQVNTNNGTIYQLSQAATFSAGQSYVDVAVRMINHINPLPVLTTSEILPGSLTSFVNPPPQADLTVVNPTRLYQTGSVVFKRTNGASALNIPANTFLKTSTNFQFKTIAAIDMAIGQLSGEALVINVSPAFINYDTAANQLCVGFSDMNYSPKFITSLNTNVTEGSNVIDFLMEVNDNISDPDFPNDPSDRHSYSISPLGTPPAGAVKFCREPGDNPSNINSPACTSCATPVAGDYWDSARCYLRFFPNIVHDANSDITKTFSFVVTVNDNGMTFPSGTNQVTSTLSITVAEINDPPVPADLNWNPLVGNTHLTPIDLGSFIEGTSSDYFIYASDPDRLANNKKISFSLEPQVYDISTSSWVNRPSGLSVGVDTPNDDPFGTSWGSRYRGKISWVPSDYEAKNFASPLGFVVKVKVTDASGTGVASYAFYKIKVSNINQLPFLNAPVSLNLVADTYYSNSSSIVISDRDFASLGAPVNFQTSLSLCNSMSTVNCMAPLTGWPDEISTYDPSYMANSSVATCRTGGGVRPELALPRLTRSLSPSVSGDRISYAYMIEWCPQKGHIGNYTAFINMKDNGDKDRNDLAAPSQEVMAPIGISIVAPVFFLSPGRDISGTVVHFMKRAFVGRPYTYKTLIKNSKGNAVTYSLLTAPLGMTINSSGVISWTPTSGQITSNVVSTWPIVQIKVRDNGTGESDIVSYPVEVKSALSPIQTSPSIVDTDPATANYSTKERVRKNFSVNASDGNSDPLFYRWYVDDILVYDRSATYEYFPGEEDGYTDPDGVNVLRPGQHTIKVEVTDSYDTKSFSWLVQVKNTVPSPKLAFNLPSYTSGISSLVWGPETGVALNSGSNTVNSLVFSGSYMRTGQTKNFVYNLLFQNGGFTASTSTVKNMEVLQWAPGFNTERIAWEPKSGTNFDILVSSAPNREGPFSSLVNAERLPNTLGMTSVNASHLCSGSCPLSLYGTSDAYGIRPTASWAYGSSFIFSASNAKDQILWDRDGSTATLFYSLSGNMRVVALAVNPNTKRLYASVRDVGAQVNKLVVFDIYPVLSGSSPTLVSTIDVFDGVSPDNRILDIVAVPSLNKIFALLPGTGGMAVLTDDGTGTPTSTDIQFVGVSEIGSSYSDVVGRGRKLVYNSGVNLLYGISRDSNQLFSLDPSTMELKVYASSVSGGFDSILTFNNDYLTLVISKTLGQVFIVK